MVAIENQQTTPVVETAGQNVETTEQRETANVSAETQKMLDYQRLAVGTQIESNNLQLEVKSNFLKKLDEVLEKYQSLLKDVKRLSGNNPTKAHFEEVLKDCIKDIKTMEKNVKKNKSNSDFNILSERVNEMDNLLKEYDENYQQLVLGREDVVIRSFIDSKQYAKREAKYQELENKNQAKINKLLNDAAAESLKGRDQKEYKQYLVDVINGNVQPITHPFYKKNETNFNLIKNTNPYFYNQITPQGTVAYDTYIATHPGQRVACKPRNRGAFEKGGEYFSDLLVKIGLIDENDTTKRQAWTKFGSVGLLALGGVALYNIFTKKGKERWLWIGGSVGALALMSKKDGVYKRFKDAFGKTDPSPEEILAATNTGAGRTGEISGQTQEILDTLIDPQSATIGALGSVPINVLLNTSNPILSQNSNGKFEFNYNNYKAYIDSMGTMSSEEKDLNLKAAKKLKDDPNLINNGLAGLGITSVAELELIGKDHATLLDSNLAKQYVENLSSPVNADISNQGFKPKDAKSWYEIMQLSNGKTKPTTSDILNRYKKGLITLKDPALEPYMTNSIIDLENMGMKGCNIKFNNYEELLKATKLTTWIVDNFKGQKEDWSLFREGKTFHIGVLGNIEFNNGKIKETDVINANFFNNTLKDISPTLSNNKKDYKDYLNLLWNEANK